MTDDELLRLIEKAVATGTPQLDLSYSGLTLLPPEVGRLRNLVSLDLCGNDLHALPPEIGQLRSLNQLDLRHNQLASLPRELGQLTKLRSLDLSDNRLVSLPAEIEAMTQLAFLDLRRNQLQVFPQVILRLLDLEELHLWGNPLANIPIEIEYLSRLSVLNLGRNAMTEVPPGVWHLKALERLTLDHTHVEAIPPEIRYLQGLAYLELHHSRLSTLPSEIGDLSRLLTLILHNNRITHLPHEIGRLRRLRQFDLHHNHLVSLPVEIGELNNLEVLDLSENPLPVPPEILARIDTPTAAMTYYLDHLDGRKRPLNEAKMILVGQGNVGKTSVVKRLLWDSFDRAEPKTQGIAIQPWHIRVNDAEIRLNVWDFGGQEIMHATHQFFLTKRTLYLLVYDSRLNEEENRLEYWLKIIQSFGGDSPIVIVGNKVDEQSLDLDQRGLQSKYPRIRAIVATSCVTGAGIDKLRARIAREVPRMPHIRDALLESWYAVKHEIETLQQDYIPYESYVEICKRHGVDDERSQRTLIGFLHDLGLVVSFQDDPRLEDTSILNPQWVTNGVYRILNDQSLLQKGGWLELDDLDHILDAAVYPPHRRQFILNVMRKFELCFPYEGPDGEQRYLIPDLLTKAAPASGHWDDVLAFEYHYNVLPSSIVSRFIVRMHPYVRRDLCWRSGTVVTDQGNEALILADREDKRVVIRVRGPEHTRRALLNIVRFHFETIHSSISGIQVEEKVPIPHHKGIVVDYQYLLDLEAMGEKSLIPPGLRARVEVRSLLEGVDLTKTQREAVRLRQILVDKFSWEELRTLCYDLAVDFDSLDSDTTLGKARELIAFLERRDRLEDVIWVGRQLRPDITWGSGPGRWV